MNWLIWGAVALVVIIVGLGIWVRIAPSDPARWHVMPEAVTDRDLTGGAMRVVGAGDEDGFNRLNQIIQDTPRTQWLAGAVDDGQVTYVTRSKLIGFPDYTTVRLNGKQIEIYGRLRFGRSDLGVNAARLDRWLALFAER